MRGGAFGVHSQRMLALGKNGRLSRHSRRFLPAVPDFYTVIPALYPVIPALYTVILALYPPPVIPAKAGIHRFAPLGAQANLGRKPTPVSP